MIIVIRALVLLATGIRPNLIPPALIPVIPPFQQKKNGRNQFAPFLSPAIIVLGEVIIGVLAGDPTNLLTFPHNKTALNSQGGSIGNIHMAANTFKPCPFSCKVVFILHRLLPPIHIHRVPKHCFPP